MLIPTTLPLLTDAHLRVVEQHDGDELIALIADNRAHLEPWMPWVHDYDPESTRDFVARAQAQIEQRQGAQFALVRSERLIGTIGFHAIDWANRSTSLGYWIDARQQGNGIASSAVSALTTLAFDDWGLHRVQIRAALDNARSRAVAERCGFTFEGVMRGAELVGETFQDLALYGRLASD